MLALGIGGFVLAAVFRDFVETSFDDRLILTLDSMVGASEVTPDGLVIFSRPMSDQRFTEVYSGWYWQVLAPGQPAFRSRSLWDQELFSDLDSPATRVRFRQAIGPDTQTLRLAERDIMLPGSDVVYRYMVAANTADIEAEVARFSQILAWSFGALGLGMLAAIFLQVSFGLHPLREIRRGLEAIRSGSSRRLDDDVPLEVQPLVKEVNLMLDHNDEVVSRARTHVGNLAHALKTPISVIANEAEARKNGDLERVVLRQTRIMQQQIDHHLARARAMGRSRTIGVRTHIASAVNDMIRAIRRIYGDKGLEFDVLVADDLYFWGERQDLDEILGNLMDNAAKWGRSKISICAHRTVPTDNRENLCIEIEDDGPGVSLKEREALFERGTRLDESVPGSGLGLAIVRDIAKICGGDVELADSSLGGLRVIVSLPATVPGPRAGD